MDFDFIVIALLLPSHCGFSFVFGCGVSSLVSSSVFLSMIVQQLVVIPGLSQEGMSALPSTPPSCPAFTQILRCSRSLYTKAQYSRLSLPAGSASADSTNCGSTLKPAATEGRMYYNVPSHSEYVSLYGT